MVKEIIPAVENVRTMREFLKERSTKLISITNERHAERNTTLQNCRKKVAATERVYGPTKLKYPLRHGRYVIIQRGMCRSWRDVAEHAKHHRDIGEMAQFVALVVNYCSKDGVTVRVIRVANIWRQGSRSGSRDISLGCNARSPVIWHVLGLHG